MPRFRNEEPDQSHYVDGDVVWVKIHNTEIWWPGEVTSSQDFRFVNSTRPPFAVVAFFNEKTFEQVKSAKLIYPFQCANKEEFIRLGTSKYKKSDGHNMGDKFSEDVAIAEARFLGSAHQQLSSLHSASSCSSSSRPDSLIKALLSSSTSSSLRNSSTRSSSGVPSPAGNRPESVFRIMDIGGTPKHSSHRKRRVDETYDCHMCSFRTTSMDVLLIHRRGHVETSSNYSSNSTANSTTNSSISLHRCPKTRAARRANTTNNAFDLRHLSQRRSGDSTHFLPNSVRCHSRHVSIVVDASLTDEEQQRVASIAQQTMECIERVVHPSGTSSSASASTSSLGHSRHRRRSIRNSCSSSQPQETPRRSTQHQHPRDPRSHRSNQLRATMPAPQPPTQPSKQRRLTRSMSRLQQGVSPPQSPAELPPPSTSRRGGGRRRTLAVSATPSERPAASVSRRSNPMRKTLAAVADPTETPVSSGRRKRTLQRNIMPRTPTPEPPAALAPAPEEAEDVGAEPVPEEPPTPKKSRQAEPPPPTEQQNNYAGSLELQRSLMAEWCDDEMEELPPEQEQEQEPEQEQEIEPIQHSTPNGREDEEEPKQPEDDEDMMLADRLPAKKRIRNIPKKDRRDAVRQDFDVEEHDEPIVIPDSDASSNESVVFVDDEPRQRRKRHAAGHGHGHASSNGNDKSKSTSATTTASKSCFDFEEEDDLQQQQQQEGQNGLSYRRRTCTNRLDINGKGHSEVAVALESEEVAAKLKISAPGEHFMGFDEARQEVPAAAEIEPQEEPEPEPKPAEMDAETQTEPEVEAEEAEPEPEPEVEGEAGDHLSLPIKERQKRIFKSRNKSTVATSMAVQEEVRDTVDQDQQQEQEQELPTNGNGAAAELELFNDEEESLKESIESGSRGKGSGKRRDRTKTDSSSSRRQKRRSKAKAARLQSRSPPTPVPVPEELSNNSTNTTSSSSSSSSSTSSSSSSSSSSSNHISRPSSSMLSPGHSSSNSCSIASNIAVISPEEARELQRSASGAGMMHAAIVDATQPVQRGGVLILEDIRLPNLYEPFGSMSSPSVSNDSSSRRPISRVERDEEDDDDRSQDSRASVSEQQTVEEESREREEDREEEESQKDDDDEAEADFDADADQENPEAASLLNESELDPEVVAASPEPIPLPEVAPSPVVAPEPASDLEALPVIPAPASDLAPEPPGPEPREIILKKREQELLRQYKADLVSGRTAEKCRKARERWSRPARSTEEDDPQDLLELELQLELDAESSQAIEDDQYEQEQGNREMLDHEVEQQQQEESTDSLDAELAEIQLVLPASVYQRPYRRAVSHPNAANAVAVNANARKASEYVGCPQALCDADVAKAHQQLVDLREQQRRRYSPSEAAAPEPRRQRRRSRNPASNGGELRFDVPDEAGEPKEVQESLTPHLYAGRICAVMTRPIPGYSHTFMLCSLSNNNFTPINNVALYLDSEKNHLVPVPREALLEPPRLADGHPLSAVFADIDILGGEAVAQVMEPYEAVAEPEPEPDLVQEQGEMQSPSQMPSSSQSQSQSQSQNQLQSPSQSQSQMPSPSQMQSRSQSQNPRPSLVGHPQRMATVQILLSDSEHGDDGDEERPTVEALGIMTPLSQVTDGGNAANAALPVAATSYVNAEDQQLSLHEENAADEDGNGDEEEEEQVDPNVLQLNVHGHRLELDPSMLFSIAEQPDSCVELSVAETSPTTGICSVGNTTAVLLARDILRAAQIYLQERDLQLVNVEDMTLDGEEALAVPVTDLLSQALAGSEVVDDADFVDATNAGVGMLHIDTRAAGGTAGGPAGGTGLQHHSVGAVVEPGVSVVYLSHALPPAAAHLTPPITARTNETNALLDQTPIMSTLENPSGGLHLRRVSPLTEGNLEDSLAVIGVTNSVSGVPTSLELPITVTNPAIAPRMTAPAPIVDLVQFAPFQ